MRILVTGGAGFMGKTIVTDLLNRGHHVKVLDKNTEPLTRIKNQNLTLLDGGIENAEIVKNAVTGCEIILHLAETFSSDVSEVIDIDIKGNLNLLTEAANQKIQHFLFTSTHRVYGRPRYNPIDEEHPLHPEESGRAFYAAGKLANEKLCLAFWQEKMLPATIFRFWWAFSSEIGGKVLRGLVDRALRGEALLIPQTGGGNFLHNEDAAQALRLAMINRNAFGEVFNISSGTYTSWREMAEIIFELTGSKSKIEFFDPQKNVTNTIASNDRSIAYSCNLKIEKAAEKIGYRSLYSGSKLQSLLRDAIAKLIDLRKGH